MCLKLKKFSKLMSNLQFNKSYHEEYLKLYGNYITKEKNNFVKKYDMRKILITSLFVFIPIFFTFFIDFTMTVNKQKMSKPFLETVVSKLMLDPLGISQLYVT